MVAVITQANQSILGRSVAKLREDGLDNERRREHLFKGVLEHAADRKADEPAKGDVASRSVESLEMGGLNRCLPKFLNINRMAQGGHGMSIVDLENLGLALPEPEQKNALRPAYSEDGSAALQLVANIFAAVANRLEPTIGLFSHGRSLSRKRLVPEPRGCGFPVPRGA